MAGKNIKGITIEIDGNATGLDKALKGVNNTSVKLNTELGQVNKLLKFDPSNVTGLSQKQELLTKSIENTSDKLNQLKSAQSQVEAQYKSGNIGEEQYGIDISYVDNIVKMQKITRVPKSQKYFNGVINLRGEIIPIMSLRRRFALEEVYGLPSLHIHALRLDRLPERV